NELTRNQARRLEALNSIGRAIASSLDEARILSALHATLHELLPVDDLKMVSIQGERPERVRLLHVRSDQPPATRMISLKSAQLAPVRAVIAKAQSQITHEPESALWVPIKEGGAVRGALGIMSAQ